MSKMVLLEVEIIHSHILMVLDFVIGETRAKLISVKNVILFFYLCFYIATIYVQIQFVLQTS